MKPVIGENYVVHKWGSGGETWIMKFIYSKVVDGEEIYLGLMLHEGKLENYENCAFDTVWFFKDGVSVGKKGTDGRFHLTQKSKSKRY